MSIEFALKEAKKVSKDVPVGAVIIKDGTIIASCHNQKEENQDVTQHAEILAIQIAQKKLETCHLENTTMYVSLEPCPMCAWAILQARISKIYFGSYDRQYGGFSVLKLHKVTNSKIQIYGGIMEQECDKLLEDFFKEIR